MSYSTNLVDQSRLATSYLTAFSEAPVPPRFQCKHLVDT
jgi:hypothetical protein